MERRRRRRTTAEEHKPEFKRLTGGREGPPDPHPSELSVQRTGGRKSRLTARKMLGCDPPAA